MSHYVPVFEDIVDSSIWEEPDFVVKVFLTMLAKKKRGGYVWGTAFNLSRWAKKTEEETLKALEILSAPDTRRLEPQKFDGRRIEKVDGGWLILNAEHYQDRMKEENARISNVERQARFREKAKAGASNPDSSESEKPKSPRRTGHEFCSAPTWEECLEYLPKMNKLKREAGSVGEDYTVAEMRKAWNSYETVGWMRGKSPVIQWKAAVEERIQDNRLRETNHGNNKSGTGRARTDANQNTLNDGGGINPASLGRRHIKQVPDVPGSGADWNADGGPVVSGGAAPATG